MCVRVGLPVQKGERESERIVTTKSDKEKVRKRVKEKIRMTVVMTNAPTYRL